MGYTKHQYKCATANLSFKPDSFAQCTKRKWDFYTGKSWQGDLSLEIKPGPPTSWAVGIKLHHM